VDHEEEVEAFFSNTRDKDAALRFLRKLMKRHGRPKELVTDKLRADSAALKEIGAEDRQLAGRWANNQAGNSQQPFRRRERLMQSFQRMRSLQKFAVVHAAVHNLLNTKQGHSSRPVYKDARTAAMAEWRQFCAVLTSGIPAQNETSWHLSNSAHPSNRTSARHQVSACRPRPQPDLTILGPLLLDTE
jgi:putative transposase